MMEDKLPKGWDIITLGKAISLEYGKSLPKKDRSGAGYPVMGSNGIIDEHFEYLIKGPGIIVGRKGSHGEVVWVDKNFFPIDTTYFVIPKPIVELRFAYYFLKKSDLKSLNRSTAIPGLNRTDAYNLELPLPPLPEQQRIVAKLDALFSHLDRLREKLDRIPALLKNFRQQVLTQAVTGELTKEWREGKSYTNIDGPIPIPDSWNFLKLKDLTQSLKYGSSSKSLNVGDVPVLRMGNIQDGEIDWSDLKYSSDSNEIEKYELTSGDLLFNRTNSPELVGKTAIYRGEREAIFAGYLIQIKPKESINSEFLNFVLNSSYSKKWCWEVKTDGVSQSNINAKKLGDFLVPVPSFEEQNEIVSKVNALFEISKKIESQYTSLKAKIDQLPQAILAKAFRGELINVD